MFVHARKENILQSEPVWEDTLKAQKRAGRAGAAGPVLSRSSAEAGEMQEPLSRSRAIYRGLVRCLGVFLSSLAFPLAHTSPSHKACSCGGLFSSLLPISFSFPMIFFFQAPCR